MLEFCSLYSGSTGNSLFVKSKNSKILIDSGVSAKKIVDALASLEITPEELDAILVTHEHIDHVQSLGTLSKKFDIPVFATPKTWDAMPKQKDKISDYNIKEFQVSDSFEIGDIKIKPFSIPHDAADPCGFNLYSDKNKLSIATDIGHMTNNILKNLEGSSFIMLESNYDPNILKCSPYPYKLKERIAGPNGHLPNNTAGKTLSYLINTGLKSAMLGHLSKENNFPELAYKTVMEEIMTNNYDENSVTINVARRDIHSKIIQV